MAGSAPLSFTYSDWTEKDGKIYDSSGTEVSREDVAYEQRRIDRMRTENKKSLSKAPKDLSQTMKQMADLAEQSQAKTYERGARILKTPKEGSKFSGR